MDLDLGGDFAAVPGVVVVVGERGRGFLAAAVVVAVVVVFAERVQGVGDAVVAGGCGCAAAAVAVAVAAGGVAGAGGEGVEAADEEVPVGAG